MSPLDHARIDSRTQCVSSSLHTQSFYSARECLREPEGTQLNSVRLGMSGSTRFSKRRERGKVTRALKNSGARDGPVSVILAARERFIFSFENVVKFSSYRWFPLLALTSRPVKVWLATNCLRRRINYYRRVFCFGPVKWFCLE